MAQVTRAGKSFLFTDGKKRVYLNATKDLFVEDIQSGVTMRIDTYPHHDGGLLFTTDARVEPVRVTNMIGWRIGLS